jgi:phosphoglucosamine mutase
MSDYATTGDGLLTGLQVAAQVAATGRPLRELAGVVARLPQVLVNVSGVDRNRTSDPAVQSAVAAAERRLGQMGRVLLRPSGTEPLVRVMVEAATRELAQEIANSLAEVVRRELAVDTEVTSADEASTTR